MNVPAPGLTENDLALIDMDINLLNILEISEVDSIITLQFQVKMTWFDPRLTFENLKEHDYLNTIGNEAKAKIWVPQVRLL